MLQEQEIKARPKEFETDGKRAEKLLVDSCLPAPRMNQVPQGCQGQPSPEKRPLDQEDENSKSVEDKREQKMQLHNAGLTKRL